MEEKNIQIPYIVYESTTTKLEYTIKKLWILCIILVLTLVLTNAGWIYYENQWEVVESTFNEVTQELNTEDGGNAVINDGVHINGTSKANSKNHNN